MKSRHGNDEPEDMAWPREESEGHNTTPTIDKTSTRDVEQHVQKVLKDREPHVTPKQSDEGIETKDETEDSDIPKRTRPYVQRDADPLFVLMVLAAISIGLTPMDAVLRYVILWSLLGGAGIIATTLGTIQHIRQTTPDDLLAGIGFGLGVGIPFLIILGAPLKQISERMFDVDDTPRMVMDTWVFMAVIFVQPATDSLFFRGAVQEVRNLFLTAILATAWTVVLFFPHMRLQDVTGVAMSIGLFFTLLSFLYSYVRFRNGLAAAWLCQVVVGGLLWFFSRLIF